jgi:hypothetical protein
MMVVFCKMLVYKDNILSRYTHKGAGGLLRKPKSYFATLVAKVK